MPALYPSGGESKPFVPSSRTSFLSSCNLLVELYPEVGPGQARETVAHALGWSSSAELLVALKSAEKPSLLDEVAGLKEARRRWGTQLAALADDLSVHHAEAEGVLCQLALTCTPQTARATLANTGPWGRFVEPPDEIAEGIEYGPTGRFRAYRLSPSRQAQVPPELRVDAGGWYEDTKYGWRVIASFPELFDDESVGDARPAAAAAAFRPGLSGDYAGEAPVIS